MDRQTDTAEREEAFLFPTRSTHVRGAAAAAAAVAVAVAALLLVSRALFVILMFVAHFKGVHQISY